MFTSHPQQIDANLRVRPLRTAVPFPVIKKPQPIGFFSINGRREFERNDSQLRYFKEPTSNSLPFDLNVGLSTAIKKPESSHNEPLDSLLKFIYDHHRRILVRNPAPEFVSWRGLLRLIMCTPYEYRQDWCILVTRFNDTIYMFKRETAQEEMQRAQENEQQKTCCAWGFKFEQYCLSESPFKDPDTSCPVNECEEFSLVYHTSWAGIRLLYGAEMDGVVSEQPLQLNYDQPVLNDLNFVEVKVRQDELNARQHISYLKHKTRNWWCQSFLVGVKDLYVGMRSGDGIVRKVKRMDVGSLAKNGAEEHWAPWMCANFLQQFLTRVKAITAGENCPYTVYEFYFHSQKGRITYERLQGKTDRSFIPDWYINLLNRLK